MNRYEVARRCLGLILVAGGLLACSGEQPPRKGQIMIALQTDMSVPEDVSHVRILVFKNGSLKFDQKYRVGKDGDQIPATLGVVASDNASDTTEVRVLSYQGGTVRTLNRVVTTIPPDRLATLRVPIEWLCDGQVMASPGIPDTYDSSCPNPDEACVAGRCQKVHVDPVTLPDFRREDITGGAVEPTKGLCFDAAPCLDGGIDVVADASCVISIPTPAVQTLNVGLRLPSGKGGICGSNGACYIPLDRSDKRGWRVLDGDAKVSRVQLPAAVCDKLAAGEAQTIRVTAVCTTKTENIPTCGPWTSIGTANPDTAPDPSMDPGLNPNPDSGTGPGPDPDPSGACPALDSPSGPIARNPQIDQLARLIVEADQRARDVRVKVAEACASIAERIGGVRPGFDPALTDTELAAVCAAAKTAVPADTSTFQTRAKHGTCFAATAEQLAGEAGCMLDTGCRLGTFAARCVPRLTTCEGSCSGECSPGQAMLNVSCEGSCNGQCVGTCSGACFGPGGNPLPDSQCMGQCDGSCSGTCEGQCMGSATCEGVCRGTCAGSVTAEFCEGPLDLPPCAATLSCTNLAAAMGALHGSCLPSSAFVIGTTAPEVAPAISDNLPRLLLAQNTGFLTNRAFAYLDGAARALQPSPSDVDLVCFQRARERIAPSVAGLNFASTTIEGLLPALFGTGGPVDNTCTPVGADDPCAQCVKATCCGQLLACQASTECVAERQCLDQCRAGSSAPATCLETCGTAGALSPTTTALLDCQATCSACGGGNMTAPACLSIGAAGSALDDFEDRDLSGAFGAWSVFDPADIVSTLSLLEPGAGGSVAALGAAGGASPGLSLLFNSCVDASQASGLAFDAMSPDAVGPTPLTVRLRTRSTETAARGGNCMGAACGDPFMHTTNVAPMTYTGVRIQMGSFLNSLGQPPDLKQIVGADFVVFGGSAQQIALDNVRFEGQ